VVDRWLKGIGFVKAQVFFGDFMLWNGGGGGGCVGPGDGEELAGGGEKPC